MSDSVQQFQVLFVDDSRDFLDVANRTFGSISQGQWQVLTAPDVPTASTRLKEHAVDLIILDVRMPDISGLQLIGILQKEYPSIPKVFLAGVVEESDRIAGLESGAALFLEKPTTSAGFQSVYATLNELLKWREKRGSTAAPRAGILDLIKLECSSANSRVFEVFNAEVRGLIYIKDGAIVHAECPSRRGQSAFSHLTTLLDGEFNLRQFTDPPERSVVRQWEFLYLEAVQLREQLAQVAEEAKAKAREASATQPQPAAIDTPPGGAPSPPDVAPSPPPAAPAPAPLVSDEEATRQLFRRPAPPPQPGAVPTEPPHVAPEAAVAAAAPPSRPAAVPVPVPAPARAPSQAPPLPPPQLRMLHPDGGGPSTSGPVAGAAAGPPDAGESAPRPRILELLACNYRAEVLHDWQCPNSQTRLQLVEVARDRSERLTQHLPLGPVDRLEFQATDGRFLLQFQEDGALLLRSASGVAPGPPSPGQFHQSMGGWLARHSQTRGLLAAGVIRPTETAVVQTQIHDYSPEALAIAWQCVQELFELLPTQGMSPWQLRWVWEQAQLYAVRREDGRTLVMFLAKDSAALDTETVEKIFRDFRSLEAA